ncbi:MAG: hypothetical protein CMJ58_11605 [Planctomycetaceae bacterium]|nr:hypothetical protein [Planctomycetaceae bacterium]
MTDKTRMIACAVAMMLSTLGQAVAQQSTPPMSDEEQALEALLSEADVFYKKSYVEGSQRWEFKIAYSEAGETTMMAIFLRQIGTWGNGDPINIVYCWTRLTSEQPGPAAIKLVASLNDRLAMGNLSATEYGVFANMGIPMKGLTAPALDLALWQLHHNAIGVKGELDKMK